MDRYDLYTLCVQDPPRYVRFLEAIHGGSPRVLRDDFAGPGAIALAWARSKPGRRAIAVDTDPEPMKRIRHPRVVCSVTDVRKTGAGADIITALNFGACELHTRRKLSAYFSNAHKTLKSGGILVCDLYGGVDAYEPLKLNQKFRGPEGESIAYTWEQAEADPTTAMVTNYMHFRVTEGNRTRSLDRAFSYRWRLWTIPEVREAMSEAGFESTQVYDRLGSAIDERGDLIVEPMPSGEPLDESWVAYCVGRKAS